MVLWTKAVVVHRRCPLTQHPSTSIFFLSFLFDRNKVGGFIWPAERAREGDVETILVSSSAAASNQSVAESSLPVSGCRGSNHGAPPTMLSPHSVKQHEKAAEAQAVSARERRHRPPQQEQEQEQQKQQQLRGGGLNETPARSRASTSSKHGGGSTHRSDSTCAPSSSSSSIGSYSRSRPSSFRSTATSSSTEIQNTGRTSISGTSSRSSRSGSSTRSKRRTPRPTSYDATNQGAALATAEHQLSHRSSNAYGNVSSAREHRLRPPTLRAHRTPPPPTRSSARSATSRLSPVRALDPVFDRHHKYDLIAEETAAQGGEVTGRFGKVHGSSVLAASQLTSELSTPWSHVLRGQKW